MKYKVLDVISRATNETADKFGIIGLELTAVALMQIGSSAVLRSPNGKYLETSVAQEIAVDDHTVQVTTLNTIYVLQLINNESEDAK